MIPSSPDELTADVLSVMARTPDPRLAEIMTALVKHLHAFAREVQLTEAELRQAAQLIVAMGQQTNERHNEVVLMAGSLGLTPLVTLINNGGPGRAATSASQLGPFWRQGAPRVENDGTIVRSPTTGPALWVQGQVVDDQRRAVAGAEVDVWHSSPVGLYENQDDSQANMNLRGRFVTDETGRFSLWTVKPAGYPIPIEGVVGELIRAQGRRHYRPAHLHALIYKPGFKTISAQVYVPDDPDLERDCQFGVTRALVGDFVRHDEPPPRAGLAAPWYSLHYTFTIEPGEARWPQAPIR